MVIFDKRRSLYRTSYHHPKKNKSTTKVRVATASSNMYIYRAPTPPLKLPPVASMFVTLPTTSGSILLMVKTKNTGMGRMVRLRIFRRHCRFHHTSERISGGCLRKSCSVYTLGSHLMTRFIMNKRLAKKC